MLFSLFSNIDYTQTLSKLLMEYGKRFHISIPANELHSLKSIYPLVLQLYYEKLHLDIATYDLWIK